MSERSGFEFDYIKSWILFAWSTIQFESSQWCSYKSDISENALPCSANSSIVRQDTQRIQGCVCKKKKKFTYVSHLTAYIYIVQGFAYFSKQIQHVLFFFPNPEIILRPGYCLCVFKPLAMQHYHYYTQTSGDIQFI